MTALVLLSLMFAMFAYVGSYLYLQLTYPEKMQHVSFLMPGLASLLVDDRQSIAYFGYLLLGFFVEDVESSGEKWLLQVCRILVISAACLFIYVMFQQVF